MSVAQTFYVHEKREYSVEAALAGRCVVKEASHPTSVRVNEEFSWHVVGHVADAVVRNPGVGYLYKDGPADSIKLVRKDGTEVDCPKGMGTIAYLKGDVPVCIDIDSRNMFRGAKFPVAGTYTIYLSSGFMTDAEAAMGVLSLAGMYELVTSNVMGFEGAPFIVDAWYLWFLSTLGAFAPIIVVGGTIAANELLKHR